MKFKQMLKEAGIVMFSVACLGMGTAQAGSPVSYGAGVGTFDVNGLGDMGALFFGAAEKQLAVKGAKVSLVGRIAASTDASTTTGVAPNDIKVGTGINYMLSGMVKSSFDLSRNIQAYGLLGYSYADFDGFITANGGTPLVVTSTDSGFTYGIGAELQVNRQVSVGVEYVNYMTDLTSVSGVVNFSF